MIIRWLCILTVLFLSFRPAGKKDWSVSWLLRSYSSDIELEFAKIDDFVGAEEATDTIAASLMFAADAASEKVEAFPAELEIIAKKFVEHKIQLEMLLRRAVLTVQTARSTTLDVEFGRLFTETLHRLENNGIPQLTDDVNTLQLNIEYLTPSDRLHFAIMHIFVSALFSDDVKCPEYRGKLQELYYGREFPGLAAPSALEELCSIAVEVVKHKSALERLFQYAVSLAKDSAWATVFSETFRLVEEDGIGALAESLNTLLRQGEYVPFAVRVKRRVLRLFLDTVLHSGDAASPA